MRKHFVFVCTLAIAAAFFSAASSAQAVVDTSGVDATQGGRYVNDGGMDPSRQDISGALANASGCLFTSDLGELLSSLITYLAAQVLGEDTTEAAAQLMKVPTDDSRTSETLKNIRAKDVCAWAPFGFCIIPSLDAMAFCFVNQVIDYIGQATVEWIKTGFKGSPAFIDDPEKFFTNAVDSVAGQLLNQISDGLLCSPWRAQIQLRLLNEHVGSFQNSAGGCRLSEVSDRWEQFAESGQAFSWDLQYAYTQNPYNNPIGSYVEARNAFNVQLAQVQNGLQVQAGWSDGFLHVKDPETGRITTPGRVLESQINRRLGNAEHRLLIADEFDEIINALVNELIKLALSEVFDGNGDSESEDGELYGSFQIGDETVTVGGNGNSGNGGNNGGGTTPTDPDGGTDGIGTDLTVSCLVEDPTILEGQTATVTAKVSGSVGSIRYDWDKDFTGANATSTKRIKDEGTYTARITVSDKDWDKETATATCEPIKVSEDFKVTCTVDKPRIEPGERVLYTAEVTGNDGEVVEYTWRGSAGGSGKSISKRYTVSGTYDERVEVVDKEGNREEVECPRVTAAR